MKPFDLTIDGKAWRVSFPTRMPTYAADAEGLCDNPKRKSPRIRCRRGLTDKRQMEVLAHETAHAVAWNLDEECIDEMGRAIAEVLWQAGYRSK